MDWSGLADAFVAVMQALSLGALCCGAVISIREALGADSPPGHGGRTASVAQAQQNEGLEADVSLDGTR
jgi:hypothetical protein